MERRQLESFVTVVEAGSFHGAAARLYVTQSAVSQSVKQLEDQLRVVLLTRTTRSVLPTEAGRRLVENAGPAMKLVPSMRRAVRANQSLSCRCISQSSASVALARSTFARLGVP